MVPTMYVCLCKQITDKEVVDAIADGHSDVNALSEQLGLGSICGACRGYTRQLISEVTTVGAEDFDICHAR